MLGVHHIAVLVSDLDRAEGFYGGLLGLRVRKRWMEPSGAPRSIWFHLENKVFLAVEKASAPSTETGALPPRWHMIALTIASSERDAWRAKLERAGVAIERATDFTLYFRDPDQNLVGLSCYPTD
jgi:hypothetical protein